MNLLGLGLGIGLLAAGLSPPTAASSQPEGYTLSNGLRVVLHDDPAASVVAVRVLYALGQRDDPPHRQGTAHLLEHMLFGRTAHLPRTVHAEFARMGAAAFNGTTTADYVQLYEIVPPESLGAALRLESDRMGFPLFDTKQLGREKLIVARERIERLQANPWGAAEHEIFGRLFPPAHSMHPASDSSTASISLPQLRRLTSTAVVPNNAVLVLSGDLPDNTKDLIEEHFASLQRGKLRQRERHDPAPLPGEIRVEISGAAHAPTLAMLGWHAPHRGEPLAAAARVTAALLQRRRGRGGSTQWLAQHYGALTYAVFFLGAAGHRQADPAMLTAELDAALDDLEANPPTSQELTGAKKRIAVRMGRQLDTLHMRTEVLAESAAEGVPDAVDTILTPVGSVTSKDVLDFTRIYLRGPRGRVLVLQRPTDAR